MGCGSIGTLFYLTSVASHFTSVPLTHRTLCVFVRASLHMRREEKPTRCHCMLYRTYDMLNMFRALLCPSPGALDYMFVFAAYGVPCLAAGCQGSGVEQQAVRPGRGTP